MTKRKPKGPVTLPSPDPELSPTGEETPNEALAILWKIARDPEQSGTARVAGLPVAAYGRSRAGWWRGSP